MPRTGIERTIDAGPHAPSRTAGAPYPRSTEDDMSDRPSGRTEGIIIPQGDQPGGETEGVIVPQGDQPGGEAEGVIIPQGDQPGGETEGLVIEF